jgi:two-component system response regulator YesN
MCVVMNDKRRIYRPVIALAQHYKLATGVSVRVFDSEVQEIYRDDEMGSGCLECQQSSVIEPTKSCMQRHMFSVMKAKEFGGRYVYECHSGFAFWASPVIVDGKHLASVVAGSTMASLGFKESFVCGEFGFRSQRLSSLAEILFLSCVAMSNKYASPLLSRSSTLPLWQEFSGYREFIELLESGENDQAKELSEQLVALLMKQCDDKIEIAKERALEVALFVSHSVGGATSRDDFNLNLDLLGNLQEVETASGLIAWFYGVVDLIGCVPLSVHRLKHGNLLVQAVHYMYKNFDQNLTLEEVAMVAKLSNSYFSRLFKSEMGIGFTEYLNNIRINESKKKLKFSQLSLAEIAISCGFADQSYFTKIFKRHQNLSPGRYRQACQEQIREIKD